MTLDVKRIWLSTGGVIAVFAASTALGADMPVGSRYAPPPPMYHWEGFYLGVNLGGAFSSGTATDNLTGVSFSGDHAGALFGGTFGYNWQFTPNFVVGAEAMFDGTSIGRTHSTIIGPSSLETVKNTPDTIQTSADTKWISTVALRFGYAENIAQNNWLFYGKVGGGWAQTSVGLTDLTGGHTVGNTNVNSGWLAGAGFEYGLTRYWTLKAEYDYFGMFSWTSASSLLPGDTITATRDIMMFTVGANYKF